MEFLIKWMILMLPIIFSPGPTNIVVGSSWVRFGVAKTLPLIAGVNSTIFVMALIVGSGFGSIFSQYPLIYTILKYIGVSYVIYIAYKFYLEAKSAHKAETLDDKLSYKFIDGIVLQSTNPKV